MRTQTAAGFSSKNTFTSLCLDANTGMVDALDGDAVSDDRETAEQQRRKLTSRHGVKACTARMVLEGAKIIVMIRQQPTVT